MKNPYRGHIRIPSFDRRIRIQEYVEQRTDSGHEKLAYQDLAEVWAFREIPASLENLEVMKETLTNEVVWYIRYRKNINAKMILIDDQAQRYDITGITEIGRKKYLKIKTLLHE